MVRKTLHRLVAKSEERAFAQLFNAHADAVYRFVYWRVNNEDEAKDLVSDVFSKAWQKWSHFDGEYPKAWLFTIARNLVIDSYRKHQPLPLDSAVDLVDDTDLEEQVDKSMASQALHHALTKLKPLSRQVLELRFMAGLSARETAQVLDTTEENIRVMQYRALRELRKYYEK